MIAAAAGVSGCSPSASAPTAEAAATTRFLAEVGRVRSQLATENLQRIPALIRARDDLMLTDETGRISQYRLALAKIDAAGVDPLAVRFRQSVDTEIGGYRAACAHSAELFRELKDSDAKPSDRGPLLPAVAAALQSSQGDTLGAVDTLVASMDALDTSGSAVLLAPIVGLLRADRSRLSQAQHDEEALAKQLPSPAAH